MGNSLRGAVAAVVIALVAGCDGGAEALDETQQEASSLTQSYQLSGLGWVSASNGWGPVERDTSNGESAAGDGHPLTLQGVTYARGLGVHAASDVRFDLGGSCSSFTSSIGVDDEVQSNGSVVFRVYGDGTLLYDSGLMTGSSATRTVSVSLLGYTQLRLVLAGGLGGDGGTNDITADHADWADARIACDKTPAFFLSDLTWSSAVSGWGPVEKDRSNHEYAGGDGLALTLNGKTYAKGLGAHAVSDIRYALNGWCSSFITDVGIDDEVGNAGSVVFEVYADGVLRWSSGLMTGASTTRSALVDVSGRQELRLVITNGGGGDAGPGDNAQDHGDWAGARVACSTNPATPRADAGTPPPGDAGVKLDGGTAADAGTPPPGDAGVKLDGGTAADAGTPPPGDAGVKLDGGTTADAGVRADAG